MNLNNIIPRIVYETDSDAIQEYNTITQALVNVYNGSNEAKVIMDQLHTDDTFLFLRDKETNIFTSSDDVIGTSSGRTYTGQIALDVQDLGTGVFINQFGTAVAASPERVIAHEMVKAITGQRDTDFPEIALRYLEGQPCKPQIAS